MVTSDGFPLDRSPVQNSGVGLIDFESKSSYAVDFVNVKIIFVIYCSLIYRHYK